MAPLVGTFCGTPPPRLIPSHGNEMYLRLITDYSYSGRGFRILWDSTSTGFFIIFFYQLAVHYSSFLCFN